MARGTRATLRICSPDTNHEYELAVEVRWRADNCAAMGLPFVGASWPPAQSTTEEDDEEEENIGHARTIVGKLVEAQLGEV